MTSPMTKFSSGDFHQWNVTINWKVQRFLFLLEYSDQYTTSLEQSKIAPQSFQYSHTSFNQFCSACAEANHFPAWYFAWQPQLHEQPIWYVFRSEQSEAFPPGNGVKQMALAHGGLYYQDYSFSVPNVTRLYKPGSVLSRGRCLSKHLVLFR